MRFIKASLQSQKKCQIIIEHDGLKISAFDFGSTKHSICFNDPDNAVYCLMIKVQYLHKLITEPEYFIRFKNFSTEKLHEIYRISMLAYTFLGIPDDELDVTFPGEAKIPKESFWKDL